jgi:phosphatidylglycerol:prolipoprotein diacylglycerol transferase
MALAFPNIDPVIVHIGNFGIRWYAVAYMVALVIGWRTMRRQVSKPPHAMTPEQVDDFLTWATLGVVLGGRLGYVLFYKPLYYLQDPLEILAIHNGGMSFHGGALGVILAIALFVRYRRLNFFAVGDAVCSVVPIGLFFGRIANFINGELFGRPAPPDLPWAMVFPAGGPLPRHPSQLYEAGLEGLLLFTVLQILWRNDSLRLRRGFVSGAFLAGYGLARIVGEFFRQPDPFLGFLWGGATMGQLLSIPLVLVGAGLMMAAKRPA